MTCNVGGADRIMRIVIGTIAMIMGFALIERPAWSIAAFLVAGIVFLTALIRYCPLNRLLGVNTCRPRIDRR